MKVLIIGAGLIGICTASFLRLRGHEVTVIERETGPGLQTSFANGALVTPSMPEPWDTPGCWAYCSPHSLSPTRLCNCACAHFRI